MHFIPSLYFFQLSVRASDQRHPVQTGDTVVLISVRRNQFSPDFKTATYMIAIPEHQPINSIVYLLQATDRNPRVRMVLINTC